MMKILFLANPNSAHTIKWITSLAENKVEIVLFGLGSLYVDDYLKYDNIKIITANKKIYKYGRIFSKLSYLISLFKIRNIIKEHNPDILHAHYASSYGFLGALCGVSPFFVSVWGSDVFDFPKKSFVHKMVLMYVLYKADKILSTSDIMKQETSLYTSKNITVLPFGIDANRFRPFDVQNFFDEGSLVIGTIKALEDIYGIQYLIQTFKLLVDKYPHLPLRLLIVGEGSLQCELEKLVHKLSLGEKTIFTGHISSQDIACYHNMLSIYVALSKQESFGVSVLEASSCEKPVIVSNVGGLPEIVEDNVTGFVVKSENSYEALLAIEKILLNSTLRNKMGKKGRKRVKRLYNWDNNVEEMILIYKEIIKC